MLNVELGLGFLSVVGVLAAAARLQPSGTYCFASGKRVIETNRNIGVNNFKSQIVNFKMPTAKGYTQL